MKTLAQEITHNPKQKLNFRVLWAFLLMALSALALAPNATARAAESPNIFNEYSVQILQPPPDTTEIWYVFINDKGDVVMQYFSEPPSGEGQGHTAVLENGQWKVIDVPDSFWCGTSNPNASGRIGVVYVMTPDDDENGIWHNAIYDRGTYTPLRDHPDWGYGIQEINDHGMMTGIAFARDCEYRYRGLLLNASLSLFKIFEPPGAYRTYPFGINNAGWLVGFYNTAPHTKIKGFLSYLGDSFAPIDFPEAVGGIWPFAINNKGEIAGMYLDTDDMYKGFLVRGGKYFRFIIPNTQYNTVDWLVDNGSISGNLLGMDGKPYAFIAKRVASRK